MSDAQATLAGWQEMTLSMSAPSSVSVGLIALANDSTIEPDLYGFLGPENIRIQTNRIPAPRYLDVKSLHALKDKIADTAAGLMTTNHLDVMAFGCTSASMALGSAAITEAIHRARPNIKVANPVEAALKGLRQLGCSRISLLTPYIGEVNALVEDYLVRHKLDLVRKGYFPVRDNDTRSHVSLEAFEAAADYLMNDSAADALFISCTALRTAPVIEHLEKRLGKPVVTSNQALAWDCLRQAGDTRSLLGLGQLMRT
ncbi:aspartate/glutamate racemase family protein [Fodinicurvata halophila]|uniref:Aspartate/glutamate racemase family protein n=1 Tax=Fodinicurvata halophila TaxID=1419723 RepID=A0ABV8UH97_9PROT